MKVLLSLFFVFSLLFARDATIDVIKKADSLPTIAIEDSTVDYDEAFKLKFYKMMMGDLNVLSIFNVEKNYKKVPFEASRVDVTNKDMSYVLRYKLINETDGSFGINVKLISKDSEVFSKSYKLSSTKIYPFAAHSIAYDLNSFMGEEPIEWIKKKVVFTKMVSAHVSQLVISDYTLSYQHVIISGGFNTFPKWSDANQTGIYYTSLDSKLPTLKYLDIKTGKISIVKSSDGMMICSDVSADGSKLLLTMAPKGQPDVYLYDLRAKSIKQLTNYGGIDVNGQFMDGNKIAFVSDRLGNPNIFTLNLNNNSVEQVVFYGKNNSACSASGDYIVYKARESSELFGANTFNLHMISTKTDMVRRLTAVGVNEFPKFSKDSDAIIFIKNYESQSSIGVVRLGYNKTYLYPLASGKIQSIDW